MAETEFGPYVRSTTFETEARVTVTRHGDTWHPYEGGEVALWLPHDCDEWLIASGSREEVLARGEEFIASVRAAVDFVAGLS